MTPDGTLAPVALSDNGADGYTDYAIGLAGSGETNLSLPYLSGRIYVSLGAKLKFKVVTDGNGNPALQYPAYWVTSTPTTRCCTTAPSSRTTRRACSATRPWWTCSACR